MLTAPLRDRFGVVHRLEFYTGGGAADDCDTLCGGAGCTDRQSRCAGDRKAFQGTPRLANRLLKRVRDYAQVRYEGRITAEIASEALDLLEVDRHGLDATDRAILLLMIEKFGGGPVGLDTLSAAIGEDSGTIEDVYEPYLIKNGFINRTPKGRVATDLAYTHIGQSPPTNRIKRLYFSQILTIMFSITVLRSSG